MSAQPSLRDLLAAAIHEGYEVAFGYEPFPGAFADAAQRVATAALATPSGQALGSLCVERVAALERALREAQAVVDDGWCTPTYHAGPCRDISAALGDSA